MDNLPGSTIDQASDTRSSESAFCAATLAASGKPLAEWPELHSDDFACIPPTKHGQRRRLEDSPYLLIGFDTEYKTPDEAVTRDEIKLGQAKYRVLSYQFCARTSSGIEWKGIHCPVNDDRISLIDFLRFALGTGAREHGIKDMPRTIYLVGHFTRADVPAFSDFQSLTAFLSNVRNTFISMDASKKYGLPLSNGDQIDISVLLRDTWLLAPTGRSSLWELGKLVGVEKLSLDADPVRHKQMIRNMDIVRRDHWDVFKAYALTDAEICLRYVREMISLYEEVTGKQKVPVTLTSIGLDLLLKSWKDDLNISHLDILGREEKVTEMFDKKLGYFRKSKFEVPLEEVYIHLNTATECYHGGRNEQFWFGPGFEDAWSDYDLSSAYPTAMSLIGKADWKSIRNTQNIDDFTATTLGCAIVDFEFPPETRYPTLPIRTDHGLVFPLTGRSYCGAPEIVVARNLGAKLTLYHGVIVPTDNTISVFGDFIRKCLDKRREAKQEPLKAFFWKEIANSTYGKTAQGLRAKRVFDIADRAMTQLPESKITNPFFACFITSFVRAILGEIINDLPATTCVFSCTTDGFLTNATQTDIDRSLQGPLASVFATARKRLTSNSDVLEIKHTIRQPLGWRTRGQATLKPGLDGNEGKNIVLAKGGIWTSRELETTSEKNNHIVGEFFSRTQDSSIPIEAKTGIRDIVLFGADLVDKKITKRLNMEFDWKRQPFAVGMNHEYRHVAFSTQPWHSVAQFNEIRAAWSEYNKAGGVCIKTEQTLEGFAAYLDTYRFRKDSRGKYLAKQNGDVRRLRMMLCSAWKNGHAGLDANRYKMSAADFAELLTNAGLNCKRADVENGKKKSFQPWSCPPTDTVLTVLQLLKETAFPTLVCSEFLYRDTSVNATSIRTTKTCPFIARCCELLPAADSVDLSNPAPSLTLQPAQYAHTASSS